jgi:hypothetical protein
MRAAVQLLVSLLAALLCAAQLAVALPGCNEGHEVGNSGEYSFLPGADVDDLAPYSLEHLLIVEDDAETRRAYVYLFAGELAKAALGLPDLRRIALSYGRYEMAFDAPRARYADERVETRGASLSLELDSGQRIELARLDGAGLIQSGASRWLSSVASSDYDVRAYFAVIEREGDSELSAFAIADGETELAFEPELSTPELDVQIEDELLTLDYGELDRADSLTIDLWQQITSREEPHTKVEAEVRTLLPPGAQYAAGVSLVTDAAGQGCWSSEQPLGLRVAQLARRYDDARAGSATIHLKLDAVWLEPEAWTTLLAEPKTATYCKDYE